MVKLTVALTGSIGVGKSTVCQYFQALGVPIISADVIAKELTKVNTPAYQQIKHYFGGDIIQPSLELDRKALGQIIFTHPDKKAWLESLLHPIIEKEITKIIADLDSDYCLVEIPLLKPQHNYAYIQRVLLVTAPIEQKLDRVIKRDTISEEKARNIIAMQPQDEERQPFADDVITNDGSTEQLQQRVQELHQHYLGLVRAEKLR